MECEPLANDEVVRLALPLPLLRETVPSTAVPDLNVTVPVGIPVVDEKTVAVKITAWPAVEGLTEDTRFVLVVALVTT
jgi:hypothetical protein